jgi:hypothetical protein
LAGDRIPGLLEDLKLRKKNLDFETYFGSTHGDHFSNQRVKIVTSTKILHIQVSMQTESGYFLSTSPWRFQTPSHWTQIEFTSGRYRLIGAESFFIEIQMIYMWKFYVLNFSDRFLGALRDIGTHI